MMQGAPANLLLHDDALGNLAWAVGSRARDDLRVGRRVLRAAGLAGDRRPVGQLTPTEQQVVALAVALAPRPRLLLADEPDQPPRARRRATRCSTCSSRRRTASGTAVLVVTHDDAVAARMQRMVHLRDGRVGEEATAEGRWSVVGTDGSLQLPQALRADWADGSLVSVEEVAPGELRVRRVGAGGGRAAATGGAGLSERMRVRVRCGCVAAPTSRPRREARPGFPTLRLVGLVVRRPDGAPSSPIDLVVPPARRSCSSATPTASPRPCCGWSRGSSSRSPDASSCTPPAAPPWGSSRVSTSCSAP